MTGLTGKDAEFADWECCEPFGRSRTDCGDLKGLAVSVEDPVPANPLGDRLLLAAGDGAGDVMAESGESGIHGTSGTLA